MIRLAGQGLPPNERMQLTGPASRLREVAGNKLIVCVVTVCARHCAIEDDEAR